MSSSDDKANSADRCRSGLCSAHVTHHSGDCEVRRLLAENTRLVAMLEAAQLDAAAERARRIQAELERERFRNRLAEGRAN